MHDNQSEDMSGLPALGRFFHVLSCNVKWVTITLIGICVALFAMDFLYHRHTEAAIEGIPGFYALYGFFMCAALVICAKAMRAVVMRREDYYAPYDVESEAYPADQLEKVAHDD